MDGYLVMHHCTIEEKLDGSQPALQPVNRQLQPVNRPPLQPVNRQPLQQVSLNFSEVNQRQLVATHPVGPRKPTACSVGPSRPVIPPATPSGPRRPTTHSGGLEGATLFSRPANHSPEGSRKLLVIQACQLFRRPASHSLGPRKAPGSC